MFDGMTDKHINFDLSKTDNVAQDVGCLNERNILCKFCNTVLVWQGNAMKTTKHVSIFGVQSNSYKSYLIKNNLREFEPMNTYWHVQDMRKFNKIMIHQRDDNLKYLCCLNCQSAILGFQVIENPDQIYISCDRVKLENESDEQQVDDFPDMGGYEQREYTEQELAQLQAMQQAPYDQAEAAYDYGDEAQQ